MKQLTERKGVLYLTQAGLIAAAYVVLTLLIQPLSFGSLQFRLSEVLTVLPVYLPTAIPGLTAGCFIANLIGLSTGANPAGAWDLLVGTAATGAAAWLSYCWRKVRVCGIPLLSTLPPVVLNGVIVGTELYLVYGGVPLGWQIAWVALGEFVVCTIGGSALTLALDKAELTKYR